MKWSGLLLVFVWTALALEGWEPCGTPAGCFCSVPILSEIQCLSLDQMPVFEEVIKAGVLSFTFSKGAISEVAQFEKTVWDRLQHLNFIGTDHMPCNAIAALKRPSLRILSECVVYSNTSVCIDPEVANGFNPLLLVGWMSMGCVMLVAGACIEYCYLRCTVYSATGEA